MKRRPRIGITSDVRREKRTMVFLYEEYSLAIEEAGGLPLQIPPLRDPALAEEVLQAVDGIVIVGGEDVPPKFYGEAPHPTHEEIPAERFAFDWALARALLEPASPFAAMPVLGICYGCQLLAVASGGALTQDIPSQVPNPLPHNGRYPDLPIHPLTLSSDSRLRRIVGADSMAINSAHHQAPKRLGPGLAVCGISPDGVIEAFEAVGPRFLLGLEWHPELHRDRDDHQRIFRAFVDAAAKTVLDAAAAPR